ncbi:helix-turn-helix transcriptional regulator [Gottfriedia acidiceleris]|uniref:helix-turn-helix domain-containing protein n=1 Tax=Gottfriedia acidiceleris TaxID=371036 RepID=UPI002F264450
MKIGEKLRILRNSKGLTLRALEEKVHLAYSHLSKLENDKGYTPRIETVKTLADFYGVNYIDLLNEDVDLFSKEEKEFISEVDLSDKDLIEKYNFKLDGKKLTEEELRGILAYIRANRSVL